MKNIEVKSFFKTVQNTKSPMYGKCREKITWEFAGIEESDITDGMVDLEHIVTIVNKALDTFGRAQLVANSDNWEFVPTPKNTNVAALVEDIQSETSRARKVTAATLKAFAEFYQEYAPQFIGVSENGANGGRAIIEARLVPIAGNPQAVETFTGMVDRFLAAIAESDKQSIIEELVIHAPVIEWLEATLRDMASKVVTADALQ